MFGFSKMEGIRDLAVATFGSVPVRLARPVEMDGLFDNLRDPEYSSAIGLVIYSSAPYTAYEIDVNKRVRHTNETPSADSSVNFKPELDIPVAPSEEEPKAQMMNLEVSKKEKKSDEASSFSKFWNWATQLF